MSKQQGRTLVVDLNMLESCRDLFREMSRNDAVEDGARKELRGNADLVDRLIKHGTTVDMDPKKVAGFAQALANCSKVREADWERAEREQFYSEADSADWTPSGGAA